MGEESQEIGFRPCWIRNEISLPMSLLRNFLNLCRRFSFGHSSVSDKQNTVLRGQESKDVQPNLIEKVKHLKRDESYFEAEQLLLEMISREEMNVEIFREQSGQVLGVAPWCYEQLAIVYAKQGKLTEEISLLERFANQPHGPGVRTPRLLERLKKKRARLRKSR